MPKNKEELARQFHLLTANKFIHALTVAQSKYQSSIPPFQNLENRKPKKITDTNVQVKLIQFLKGSGGDNLKSYKYLTLSELFDVTAENNQEAKELVHFDFLNCQDNNKNTILHKLTKNAAQNKNEIFDLLEYQPKLFLVNNKNQTIFTILLNNSLISGDLLLHFIELGADPNTKNLQGNTVAHIFASNHKHCFWIFEDLIVQYKLDVSIKNKFGITSLEILLNHPKINCAILLTALLFIRNGSDVNTLNQFGRNILFYLTSSNADFSNEIEELVNTYNINIHHIDHRGLSAFQFATESINADCINLLCLKKLLQQSKPKHTFEKQKFFTGVPSECLRSSSTGSIQNDIHGNDLQVGNYLIKNAML